MNINIPLLALTSIAIIKDFFILPAYINVILHLISCVSAVASDLAVYSYYKSLPAAKQNVLTYIVRLFSIVSSISVVWYCTSSIVLEFPYIFQSGFNAYPNLICTALRAENIGELLALCITLVQLSKTCIAYNSLLFMNLNHEKTFKIIFSMFISVFVCENLFLVIYAGTLCTETKLKRLSKVHGIEMNTAETKKAPPIFIVHILTALLSTIMFKISEYKNEREKRKVKAFNPPVLPTLHNSITKNTECVRPNNSKKEVKPVFTLTLTNYSQRDVNGLDVEQFMSKTSDLNPKKKSSLKIPHETFGHRTSSKEMDMIEVLFVEEIILDTATLGNTKYHNKNQSTNGDERVIQTLNKKEPELKINNYTREEEKSPGIYLLII